jgi:aryl-alcohol dehydrogenase-like predicted oxidoreductase
VTRPYGEQTARSGSDPIGQRLFGNGDKEIIDAVQAIAHARGIPMAQAALAWVLNNPVVAAPIVGATKPHHLADAAAALDVHLTDEEIRRRRCGSNQPPSQHDWRKTQLIPDNIRVSLRRRGPQCPGAPAPPES